MFARASEIANAIECAENESSRMSGKTDGNKEDELFRMVGMERKCYRCDGKSHLANQCRHINTKFLSSRVGHIERACQKGRRFEAKYANNIRNELEANENEVKHLRHIIAENFMGNVEADFYHINVMSTQKNDPYVLELYVKSKPTTFETDTGAGVTAITENDYKNIFSNIALKKCSMKIKTYRNESTRRMMLLWIEYLMRNCFS